MFGECKKHNMTITMVFKLFCFVDTHQKIKIPSKLSQLRESFAQFYQWFSVEQSLHLSALVGDSCHVYENVNLHMCEWNRPKPTSVEVIQTCLNYTGKVWTQSCSVSNANVLLAANEKTGIDTGNSFRRWWEVAGIKTMIESSTTQFSSLCFFLSR